MLRYGIIILITLGFSIIDIVTGYIGAVIKSEVCSSKMRSGLLKKAILVLIIAMAALMQYGQTYIDLGVTVPILTIVCGVIIWMEVTSVLENADKIWDGKLTELVNAFLRHKKTDE